MTSVKKFTMKKIVLGIMLMIMAVATAFGFVGFKSLRAAAYDGFPSELGSYVSTVTDSEGFVYANYQRGYMKFAAGTTDTSSSNASNALAHVGGRNAVKNGDTVSFELVSADVMTTVKNWENLLSVDTAGARIAYGAGWNAEAAKKVGLRFKEKWTELIEESYNLGIPCSNIDIYHAADDGNAVTFGMHFRYGDSNFNADNGNGGAVNESYLVYNVLNDKVYALKDGFARLKGEIRRIGAPVSDTIANANVTGWDGEGNKVEKTDVSLQVFETGVLVEQTSENGRVTYAVKHEGVVEKTGDKTYVIHPILNDQDILAAGKGNKISVNVGGNDISLGFIGDVDGTWHALRTARITNHENGQMTVQFNLRAGCIEVVYKDDYTLVSRMAYAGQNFVYDNGEATRVTLPYETFTTDEHLWEGLESGALENYKKLSGNSSKTENDLKAAFREGYKTLFESGVIPGYRCSSIKMWDVLCVDYKYSPDSMYGFDGVGSASRERMYTLVYSGAQDKVYGVGDDIWQVWKDDSNRPALGAPISNELKDHTIEGKTFTRIQFFEKGYIFENETGTLTIEYGATTDGDYDEFLYNVAPNAPSQYGTITETFFADGGAVTYVNYEKGAAMATERSTGKGYIYDYYPGRNFVKSVSGEVSVKMLDFNVLYQQSEFYCSDPAYEGIYEDFQENGQYVEGAKTQIISLIKSYLVDGFFPGFLASQGFCGWNDRASQQFIYGDSTALPWGGDARTNVSAMVWNDTLNKVYLVKDAFMDVWGGSKNGYTMLGAPAGEEFKIEGYPNVTFQMFEDTLALDNKAFAVCIGYNEATYFSSNSGMTPEKYLADFEELSKPLSGVTITPPEKTSFNVGDYAMLDYVVDGASADAEISVVCSDDSIATVMADGSVEFLKSGTVTVTVTVSDGVNTFSDKVTFTVGGDEKSGCGSVMASGAAVFATMLGMAALILVRRKKENI